MAFLNAVRALSAIELMELHSIITKNLIATLIVENTSNFEDTQELLDGVLPEVTLDCRLYYKTIGVRALVFDAIQLFSYAVLTKYHFT